MGLAAPHTFFGFAIFGVTFLTFLVLTYYLPIRSSPFYIFLPIFLALVLPALATIVIVPADVAFSKISSGLYYANPLWLSENSLFFTWRIFYWSTFTLTWVVLPLLGEYVDSGYHNPRDKFFYTLRSNLRYQTIMLSCAVIGSIYFFFDAGFNLVSLKALIMALSYAWGLLIATYLLGHGLVALPRSFLRLASLRHRLAYLECSAPKIHDCLADSIDKLAQYDVLINQIKSRQTPDVREHIKWITDLSDMCNLSNSQILTVSKPPLLIGTDALELRSIPSVITPSYLADLQRRIQQVRNKKDRLLVDWINLVGSATRLQMIIDSGSTKRLIFTDRTTSHSLFTTFTILTPYMRYLVYYHILPFLSLLIFFCCAILSCLLLASEVIAPFNQSFTPVSLLAVNSRLSFFLPILLLYTSVTAVKPLPNTPFSFYRSRFLTPHATALEPAVWFANLVARLGFPLALNFSSLLTQSVYHHMIFYKFLGEKVDLTPLGSAIARFAPAVVVVVAAAAAVGGIYNRLGQFFGILSGDSDVRYTGGERLGLLTTGGEVESDLRLEGRAVIKQGGILGYTAFDAEYAGRGDITGTSNRHDKRFSNMVNDIYQHDGEMGLSSTSREQIPYSGSHTNGSSSLAVSSSLSAANRWRNGYRDGNITNLDKKLDTNVRGVHENGVGLRCGEIPGSFGVNTNDTLNDCSTNSRGKKGVWSGFVYQIRDLYERASSMSG